MESTPSTVAVMEHERLTAELDLAEAGAEPSSFVVKIRRRLPDFARSVNLKYVRLGLRSGGIPAPSSWVPLALAPPRGVDKLYSLDLLTCAAWLGAAVLLLTVYFLKRPQPVYLVDFACYRTGDEHAISKEGFLDMTESTGCFNAEALEFQTKITRHSGLGDRTYLPPGIQARPPRLSMAEARAEAEAVMFDRCLDAGDSVTVNSNSDHDAVYFTKSKMPNSWRRAIFLFGILFWELANHKICQVNFGKLLELLLVITP